jgi:D-alanine-D-alanine ligase
MKVAVLAGGRSSEHDVSLASGAAVREGLEAAGHEVLAIEIDRDGAWRRVQAPAADRTEAGTDGGSEADAHGHGTSGRGASPNSHADPLELHPGGGLLGVDVVFPTLHGPYGEDGTVQGLLETLDVAYVGAGVTASAVCLDKVLFKRVLSAGDPAIPQVRYVGVHQRGWRDRPERALDEIAGLGLPVFVKPAHLGSSVGIARVSDPAGVADALEQALAHDELAIVEAAAGGIEVECGVLGFTEAERTAAGTGGGGTQAFVSEPGEISFAGEWYDYAAKYTPGGMELIVPARISATARARVRELALRTFAEVGCEGLARVDFFLDGESVIVNELNTMPGFTPTSVYAKLLAASGIAYPELLDRLCRLGIERHQSSLKQCGFGDFRRFAGWR